VLLTNPNWTICVRSDFRTVPDESLSVLPGEDLYDTVDDYPDYR
jgi:hypothetical protein